MLVLLIMSVVIGGVVAGISGIGFLFWVGSIGFFVFGLPGALIGGFFNSLSDRTRDREDRYII